MVKSLISLGRVPACVGVPKAEAAAVFRHGAHCRRGGRHLRGLTVDQVMASVKPASGLVMSSTAARALTVSSTLRRRPRQSLTFWRRGAHGPHDGTAPSARALASPALRPRRTQTRRIRIAPVMVNAGRLGAARPQIYRLPTPRCPSRPSPVPRHANAFHRCWSVAALKLHWSAFPRLVT